MRYLCYYFVSSDYRTSNGYERAMELMDDEGDDSQNVPSDIDSQVSTFYAQTFHVYLIKPQFNRCHFHGLTHCHVSSNSIDRVAKLSKMNTL